MNWPRSYPERPWSVIAWEFSRAMRFVQWVDQLSFENDWSKPKDEIWLVDMVSYEPVCFISLLGRASE